MLFYTNVTQYHFPRTSSPAPPLPLACRYVWCLPLPSSLDGDDTDSVEVGAAASDELGVTSKDSLRKEDEELGMEHSPTSCEMSGKRPVAEHLTSDDLKADLLHD